MALPLLTTTATHDGAPLVAITPRSTRSERARGAARALESSTNGLCGVGAHGRIPDRLPGPGEQFRFHVDMDLCIGCKCCVVACNEQNGNPASINWRRVTEVESGSYPAARRAYFSMGCNHCVDPTCLSGCPVDAYSKDAATGIVRHSAETCIGCQYCTWTCSYGVPQFNPERGVVGKCDMCHGRLSTGLAPACVSACPEGAIAIEIVNVAEWRAAAAAPATAAATGPTTAPRADASLSTTRVTLPRTLPGAVRPLDLDRLRPGDPHTPLVIMTVLTQLSVGAFATIWLAELLGAAGDRGVAALVALAVGGAALAAATLHLGRPIHAYRAMKMWRRSWLSREVVLFAAFSHVAGVYVALMWFGWPGAQLAGAVTVLLGVAGIVASGCIYLVASRPAWNTPRTIAQFLLTGAVLGPLVAGAAGAANSVWLRGAAGASAVALLMLIGVSLREQRVSPSVELRATARLVSSRFARLFRARLALLGLGGFLAPVLSGDPLTLAAAAVATLGGELLGRYLFFVTAVPKHMTAPYLAVDGEAA